MNYFKTISIIFCCCFLFSACSDVNDLNDISRANQDLKIAFPLVNTEFIISDFTSGENVPNNASIVVDEEDKVTLVYNGDVVRLDVTAVFPAIPFFGFPLLDTLFTVPIPFATDQRVDKAVFGESNMIFQFTSQFEENVEVTTTIPQLSKDGQVFSETFTIEYDGTAPFDFTSSLLSVEDWVLQSSTNEITINYDARLASGERVKFDAASLIFDQVKFDYIEGYFGNDVFDINGDFIPIGVLDNWKSGGLAFEDPKVNIYVENAFGFPVRSIFNKMQIVTTTGEMLDMESDIINTNVDFAYPSLDEVGQSKITAFSFNKDNSNIVELFKERVVRVSYDIDALANPDGDDSITGFVNEDGYFLVSVDVELPLHGTVNNLVLQDTVDVDFAEFDDVQAAELKHVFANDFPADITLQGYFLDDTGAAMDSLFSEDFVLPGAAIDSEGVSLGGEEITRFEDYTSTRFDKIRSSSKMLVTIKINTQQASNGPLWIYNDYGILFKIGAKLKTSY